MKSLLAIAMQSIRSAVRSRVVFSLALFLFLIAAGLPLILKGDGTATGQVQLSLTYTLGMIRFLLAITGIWAGCSAVASDIGDRQMYLIVTKPVRGITIWLGKWLGVMMLLAVMLLGSSLVVFFMTSFTANRMVSTPEEKQLLQEEILVARARIPVITSDIDQRAETFLAEKLKHGGLPHGMSSDAALREIREALWVEHNRLAPEASCSWRFQIPSHLRAAANYQIRYKITSAQIEATSLRGQWVAGSFTKAVKAIRNKPATLRLTADALDSNGVLDIRYINSDPSGFTVLFPPQSGPELLCYAGSFAGNYSKAILIILMQLAFWSAIGITAGCLFSLPVAAFFTAWIVLLTNLVSYLNTLSREYAFRGGDAEHRIMNLLVGPIYFVLYQVIRPLRSEPVLSMLTQGERISWQAVFSELGVRVIIYCTLLAWIGHLAIKRREMGLPAKSI